MSLATPTRLTIPLLVAVGSACTHAMAQAPVTALAFAPDEMQIVAGSQAGIEIRKWPELQTTVKRDVELRSVHDLVFAPHHERLLIVGGAASEYGEWLVASWPSLEVVARRLAHDDSIYAAAWLADNRFVTVSADAKFIIWEITGDKVEQVAEFTGHSRSVLAVEAVRESNLFITAGVDQILRVWSANPAPRQAPESLRNLDNHTGAVCDLALRPGQRPIPLVASAGIDNTVRLWQPSIGRLVKFARVPVEPTCLAWSPDGSRLATGCADGKLRIINPSTVQIDQTCHALDGWIHCVAAATDGSFAVGGTAGLVARVVPQTE